MKAAILAIGTEITSGQIVNRNPSWLSSRLESLGIEVVLHLSVADEWREMKWALDQAALKADLIFSTGGLGPTTDDFTRDVVAEWAGRGLFFHEPSLKKIQETMAHFKRTFVESQRRQCYYPERAAVLANRAGTANGFSLEARDKRIWILPGPPREVEAIWNDHIEPYLRAQTPAEDRWQLFSWHCLGKPEAELAETVESAVRGSELKTGYRLHAPYVEVKLWCRETAIQGQTKWIRKVEDAIRPWLALQHGEDLADRFLNRLRDRGLKADILDQGTHGYLAERLSAMVREKFSGCDVIVRTDHKGTRDPGGFLAEGGDSLLLTISKLQNDSSWSTGMFSNGKLYSIDIESSMPPTYFNERNKLMALELSLKQWVEWLDSKN
ncbi:MAG: molybdopterin-binding protein [Bdellovibrionia bacterium]